MQTPVTRLAPVADAILAGGALLGGALGTAILLRSDPSGSPASFLVFVGGPYLMAAGSLAAFALSREGRVHLMLLVGTTFAALFVGDLVLTVARRPDTAMLAARHHHQPFDSRSVVEALQDLRAHGVPAYPYLSTPMLRRVHVMLNGFPVQPLAPAISNTVTVFCNDPGFWIDYRSDRFGFNNPPDVWDVAALDLLLIGDSFTQGICVRPEKHVAAYLRERWPATLNLGVAGSGPLFQYAIFREYRHPNPRVVLWLFYEGNDLYDLAAERDDPILHHYLTSDSTQGLAARQADIDAALRAYVDSVIRMPGPDPMRMEFRVTWSDRLLAAARLHHVRAAMGIGLLPPPRRGFLTPLPAILQRVKSRVDCDGGRLYFVYLPSYARFQQLVGEGVQGRTQVLDLVRRLGIPVIDVSQRFSQEPEPTALWLYPGGHYNDDGYRIVAGAITDRLTTDSALGSVPTSPLRGPACDDGRDPSVGR